MSNARVYTGASQPHRFISIGRHSSLITTKDSSMSSSFGELTDVDANESHAANIKVQACSLVSQPANVQEVSAGLTANRSEMGNSGVPANSSDWSNSYQPQPMYGLPVAAILIIAATWMKLYESPQSM